MKPGSVLRALMTGQRVPGVIPREYLTTDRILMRWAEGGGSGLPTEVWDDTPPHARPVPLDPDTQMVVDGVVRASPASTRRFVVGWYCSPLSTTDQAKKAGMDRDKYLKIHILTLHFMKYRLEETKDPTLARLLRALD